MIEILTAYDEEDPELGVYFNACKKDIVASINLQTAIHNIFSITEIPSRNCRLAYFDIVLGKLKNIPFIIIAYTHGNETSLIANGSGFITVNSTNSSFNDSFFYTNSCLSGKVLGPELIKQNCKVFIGYDSTITAFKNENSNISLKCDNIGMLLFLTSDITAYDAYVAMIQLYTQEYDKLLANGDPLSAALLIQNREALVFHGEKELKKEDFMA
ncbi:hypothetical protein [Persicitalea jodogahamensis]|uniref:Uncharacterized protein n=1 Tax=Persicitalea jodogahamensis TaxID=402147 RepID=A0A8J3D6W2_9BACT|nr:hypothetical protein [Persicitalea jodogahamensis]GHB83091.1 hypothetical protein GCM10007390_42550 [Persicitalea jodogahamensis]